MHDLGETVPPDFYVWRLILIEVDRVDSKDIVGDSPATSESTDRSGCSAHTKRDAVYAEHDFNQEKLRALSLLDSIFGGLKEALDSDVDMPELPPSADTSFIGT